jgi:glycosyltransferase involved in cell wall biosynthesis
LLVAVPIVGGRVRQTLRWRSDVLRATSAPRRTATQHPLVTVVTPSFRHVQWIAETIESVRVQTYPRIEHIVVDGGSDDGTEAILRAAERPGFRWLSEPDRGQADAINKGMQLAAGEIVTWLNSDDVYVDPDAVARVVDRFRQGSVVVTGPGRRLSHDGRDAGEIRVRPDRLDAATTRHVDWILQPSTFYTRELALAHPLDPTLHFAMDWDFFIRVTADAAIDVVDQPIAGYRIHRAGKTVGGGASRQRELLRVLERYHPASAWNVRVMRLMVKAHAAAERRPRKAAWLVTRSLNAMARLTNVVTNGRGLPP